VRGAQASERRLLTAYYDIVDKQAQADLMVSHPGLYWALVHWITSNETRVRPTLTRREGKP
jgi:hypothetical protein